MPDKLFWKILLVDDDEDDYLITKAMLEEMHEKRPQLEWVSTFDEGRRALASDHYDVVLMDYDLRSGTGLDLIREAVANNYPAPIILLTGRGSYDVDMEAMQAGATLYLTKTEVNPLLLERSIRYAIERIRAEQERKHILESIQDGFFAVNEDWEITYINRRAAHSNGFEPEELIGRNIWEAFPRLLGTSLEQNYRLAMHERKSVKFEFQGVYKGAWYNISVYPFQDGLSVYWQDISERKLMNESLRISEERFRKAFEATPNALVISRLADGQIELINDAFEQLFGYSRSDVTGKTSLQLNMFVNPADRAELVARIQADQSLRNIETDIRLRSGEIRQASVSAEILTVKNETSILSIIEDVTERKQAEIKLQAAYRETTDILESISDAFYSLDPEGRFTHVNQKAADLWGMQSGDLLGKNIWDTFPAEKETESYRKIQQAMETRQPIQYESYSAFLDLWLDIHLYPTRQGISVYFQDITERKRVEKELQEFVEQHQLAQKSGQIQPETGSTPGMKTE